MYNEKINKLKKILMKSFFQTDVRYKRYKRFYSMSKIICHEGSVGETGQTMTNQITTGENYILTGRMSP